MKNRILIFVLAWLGYASEGWSKSVEGIEIPETEMIGEKSLVLNGTGLREATIFNVKVYVGALYVVAKSKDPAVHLAMTSPQKLVLHFLRDVGKEKLVDAFRDGFEECYAPGPACDEAKKLLVKFEEFFGEMKKGDVLTLEFGLNQVAVKHGRAEPKSISSKPFAQQLLSVWLGKKPPNKNLKSGLLGEK